MVRESLHIFNCATHGTTHSRTYMTEPKTLSIKCDHDILQGKQSTLLETDA